MPTTVRATRRRLRINTALCLVTCVAFVSHAHGGDTAAQRTFSQSRANVEKALKQVQPFLAGHLPTLEGFASPQNRPLDRFQRGFYQCEIQIKSAASGGTSVRVSSKITAWYAASDPAHSGYQVLPSNGRLESDLLDRLQDALGPEGSTPVPPRTGTGHL